MKFDTMQGPSPLRNDPDQGNGILNSALLNLFSLSLLQPLLTKSYLPLTKSSISPANIIPILNDIVLNRRKKILEFGSGISTVLFARLIKMNRLPSTIISVEHDMNWIKVVRSILKGEGLDSKVRFIHAPLAECPISLEENSWYDVSILDKKLFKKDLFDLVIVDGPPSYDAPKNKSRYPALPYIYGKTAAEFSLYLDDVERAGEKSIISKWKEEFGLDFKLFYGTLGCFQRGGSYNLDVLKLSYLNGAFKGSETSVKYS